MPTSQKSQPDDFQTWLEASLEEARRQCKRKRAAEAKAARKEYEARMQRISKPIHNLYMAVDRMFPGYPGWPTQFETVRSIDTRDMFEVRHSLYIGILVNKATETICGYRTTDNTPILNEKLTDAGVRSVVSWCLANLVKNNKL